MSQVQTPSVGRIVHYVSYGTPVRSDGSQAFTSQCRAALVTEVDPEHPTVVGLAVINPTGVFFHPLAEGGCGWNESSHPGGTWHWPERVEQPHDPSQANQHSTIPRPDRTPGADTP